MTTHEYDIVIVGSGTSGCYAAATAAKDGLDVAVLERKDEEEAGHIACGDALKGADTFPDAIPKSKIESAFTNTGVDHGRFEIPSHDAVLNIPVPGELAVIDRWEFGRLMIEAADDAGAEFHYDTVVTDVLQDDGQVYGVTGKRKGEAVEYNAEVTIDAAGALSVLQDHADFSDATFDTNVTYSQFCSAYREIVEVPEPVDWDDALVFKPTERASGYLWYFPRTPTTINVGLGFQMSEEPMKLVQDLRNDLQDRPEFEGAEVVDKLGAALPTRRPYDSMVAPGYIAVGDAAALINPTTGGGIAGAAYSGQYAAEEAIRAISRGDVSENALWRHNERVMDHFGARYAALDVYNILSTAIDVDDLTSLLASLPGEPIAEALYSGKTSISPRVALQTLKGAMGHLDNIWQIYTVRNVAEDLLDHYERYPDRPSALPQWQDERDEIMECVYQRTGADPKY
ncbi:geranylgeranyl reductase family protein [Halolamina sp.]|uniref:geranylgeranyl reductase family protein n=1 Tax=Halolamina sp. TaxID=1940283 RepID=UPI000223BB39|nr:geranylgeranyl reductase [halophilic archaeon DL31]